MCELIVVDFKSGEVVDRVDMSVTSWTCGCCKAVHFNGGDIVGLKLMPEYTICSSCITNMHKFILSRKPAETK